MKKEQKIFSLIVKNSVFAFLKEKYPEYQFDDKDDENIVKITNLLKQLEEYAHIPDKMSTIKKDYEITKKYMDNGTFKEVEFLEFLQNESKELTEDEKNSILNAVIFVTNEDKNISDTEKEIILQIAKFLDINHSYKVILNNYKKSEFYEEPTPFALIIGGLILTLLVGVGVFYKITNTAKLNIFQTDNYQFDEVSFNRYIIYKNQYAVKNKKFKKYAVYYISGKASIGFDPKKLDYNPITKTLTVTQRNFIITPEILPSSKKEIDKVNPKKITANEANKVAIVVGLAGGFVGAQTGGKLGSGLTSMLPKSMSKFASTITASAGGLLAGSAGYFVTKKALTGLQISGNISETERKDALSIGANLIRVQLSTDESLQKMYKEHFESFIKAKLKSLNLEISKIVYPKLKEGK